jgi:hypothetical protein
MVLSEITTSLIKENSLIENPVSVNKIDLSKHKSKQYELYDSLLSSLIENDIINFNIIEPKKGLSYFNLFKKTLNKLREENRLNACIPNLKIQFKFLSCNVNDLYNLLIEFADTNLLVSHPTLLKDFTPELLKKYITYCLDNSIVHSIVRILYVFDNKLSLDKDYYEDVIVKLLESNSLINNSSLREIHPFLLKNKSTYTKLCYLFLNQDKNNIKYVIPQLISSKEDYQSLVDKSIEGSFTKFNLSYADKRFLLKEIDVTLSKNYYFNITVLINDKRYVDNSFNNDTGLIPHFDNKVNKLMLYLHDVKENKVISSVDIFNTDELKSGYDWFKYLDASTFVKFDKAQNELDQMKNRALKDKEKTKGGIHGIKRGSNVTKSKKRK